MKLISFEMNGQERVGRLSPDNRSVQPIRGAESMLSLIEHWDGKLDLEDSVPMSEVRLLAPIPKPCRDIICLGMNYQKHADEAERVNAAAYGRTAGYAVYFSKGVYECTPDGAAIESHSALTAQLDYEAELAVILGKTVRDLTPGEVPGAIFGYTVINDVSSRDVQTQHKQFFFSKSLDSFAPMGPCIVTADEFEFPPVRTVWSRVNGELRQTGVTDQLLFSLTHILTELTAGMTLPAGTIIATGTPAGVGMGFEPPRFLRPGDVVECGIEGIGTITNTVV